MGRNCACGCCAATNEAWESIAKTTTEKSVDRLRDIMRTPSSRVGTSLSPRFALDTCMAPPAKIPGRKKPFDIDTMMRRIRAAVTEHAGAAMFELAERGFKSVFQQLVGCIISIRTRDEVSLPTALRLLERAGTPSAVAKLSVSQIDALI